MESEKLVKANISEKIKSESSGLKRKWIWEAKFSEAEHSREQPVEKRQIKGVQETWADRWSQREAQVGKRKEGKRIHEKRTDGREMEGEERYRELIKSLNESGECGTFFLHLPCLWIDITCQKVCCQLHHGCSIMEQHRELLRTMCLRPRSYTSQLSLCVCKCFSYRAQPSFVLAWVLFFYSKPLRLRFEVDDVSRTQWGTQTTILNSKTSNDQDKMIWHDEHQKSNQKKKHRSKLKL